MDWLDVYRRAQRGRPMAGYYNRNVAVSGPAGAVLVRIPIPNADVMDLRLWPEPDVLAAVGKLGVSVPRLLHAQSAPPFQVHELVVGDVVNDAYPRGVHLPAHVIDDVVELFAVLAGAPDAHAPRRPSQWPTGTDTAGFGFMVAGLADRLHAQLRGPFGSLYAEFGVPDDPWAHVRSRWSALRPRSLCLIHADVHRKNMIVAPGRTTFLDWELALWGDPVYELTIHLDRMSYQPAEKDRLLNQWLDALDPAMTADWEDDLEIYFAHERPKSVVVDTARYAKQLAYDGLGHEQERELCRKLAGKLNQAYLYWRTGRSVTTDDVEDALRRWADAADSSPPRVAG
jgi:aminoglycoside phosphotransferase (APT) family kinase protein